MQRHLVAIPVFINVWVEAEDTCGLTETVVYEALVDEHGPTIHIRTKDVPTDDINILESEEV